MSTKRKNPYRAGSAYNAIFEDFRAAGGAGITRKELLAKGHKAADVTVVLSPRKESTRGDLRGNRSAQGHLYFTRKLSRKMAGGIKEPQRFSLGWREKALEPLTHDGETNAIASKKVKTPMKTPVKTTEMVTNVTAETN